MARPAWNADLRSARAALRAAHGATSPTVTAPTPEVPWLRSTTGALADARSAEAPTYTADAHSESMVPEIDATQTRPIVIDMRRVDQEWHAHLDHMELRPDPLASPQFQSLMAEITRRFDEIDRRLHEIDRRLDGISRRLDEQGRKLDKLIAQMWVLLALMGVALILELAILGLLLTR